jgi:hypothetical protein
MGRSSPLSYKQNVPCHICDLPIPEAVADHKHSLFGTIDHVQPRSQGGSNKAENRAPAHLICNQLRSTFEITPELRQRCRDAVMDSFKASPHLIPSNVVRRAMQNGRKRKNLYGVNQ